MTVERVEATAEVNSLKLTYLKGLELFRGIDASDLERFQHTIEMGSCRTGHVFYRPGETGEVMFILKTGGAQLYRLSADGRKFVFAQVPPASVFGEMACIGQGMYDCFAEATADSLICTLNRADVDRLIATFPLFASRLLEVLGRRVVQAERQLEDLAFRTLIPRLADFLLREALDGRIDGLSHQDIGDRLGVYRETATYALNELKSARLIDLGRKQIQILDASGLAKVGEQTRGRATYRP